MGVAPQGRATRKASAQTELRLPAPGLFNRARARSRARSRSLIVAGQKRVALVNEHDCGKREKPGSGGASPYPPGS
jgi:hypothetical protein